MTTIRYMNEAYCLTQAKLPEASLAVFDAIMDGDAVYTYFNKSKSFIKKSTKFANAERLYFFTQRRELLRCGK